MSRANVQVMVKEIADRARARDWLGWLELLPDPDVVLAKTGEDLGAYRALLADPHVWACYQSRKSGTLGREWEVVPAAGNDSSRDRRGYGLVRDWMETADVYQMVSDMLEAVFFGFSPLEIIWTENEGRWLPREIAGKPPEWFAFDSKNRLRFLPWDDQSRGELPPERKFLLTRAHPSYQNPYGEKALARCFWPVFFKKSQTKFWNVFAEKFGAPWVVGKVPPTTTSTERAEIRQALESMVQDAVAVVSEDSNVEVAEAAGKASSSAVFRDLIDFCNEEISKALLGQTLTTAPGDSGSYALGRVQLKVREDLIEQDRRMTARAFDQLFAWMVELNFDRTAPPRFSWYEAEDLQQDRAERDAVLAGLGVHFSKSYFLRSYNFDDRDLAFEAGENIGPKTESTLEDENDSTL